MPALGEVRMGDSISLRRLGWVAAAALIAVNPQPVWAQASAQVHFELPAMALSKALRQVAIRTGRDLLVPAALVRGRRAPALSGDFDAEQAVQRLLEGSGLALREVDGTLVIETAGKAAVASLPATGQADLPDPRQIVVTGSRIRGAPIASPVIRLDRDKIRKSGGATLAEAVRTIPQNFGGGQNPGIGNNVPASSGVNVGSSTSVNLRGLGSDATLTLVNGHRISYSASRQAIDISSIPLGAVDRIEIVPDGASALYGSDAVAGVVNVILRPDYDGIETSARVGAATDGGDFEQRYGLVAGKRWSSGGMIVTYEFGRSTAIDGRDRSYSADNSPALTLFPLLRNHSATFSAHQELAPDLRFEVDSLFNDRFSTSSYALNAAGDISLSGARFAYKSRSFAIAPTLKFSPGGSWRLFLTGSYGLDHTHYDVTNFFQGLVFKAFGNCYCNNAKSIEAGGDGTLLHLGSGDVKLAAGAGYRSNKLVRFNGPGADTNVSKGQDSVYAYGELSVPLVAPAQSVPLVRSLSLSGAFRYERYPHVGEVVTPKVGLIYAPSEDFEFKGSWGKSFRAPTLYQQFQARNAVLAPPFVFGGTGFAPDETALLLQGGNADLKPERATSWSATVDVHPKVFSGASLELSYFDTRYRDRVVTPIIFLSQALSDPVNSDRLTFDPGPALLAEIIAGATSFGNATGQPYDPSKVAVFIDDRNVNAGYQRIRGGDLLLSYTGELGNGELHAEANATYLDSEQQLSPVQPVLPLAGIIFNPPHVRARGELGWSVGPVTLTGNVTYVGGVSDRRAQPAVRVGSMATVDATLLYRGDVPSGWRHGLTASLTVQNLFNAKPDVIATTLPSDTPYDSTNYSPVGRFVAASVIKSW
jgi:outer membrane receptor protein involved in Fe transport